MYIDFFLFFFFEGGGLSLKLHREEEKCSIQKKTLDGDGDGFSLWVPVRRTRETNGSSHKKYFKESSHLGQPPTCSLLPFLPPGGSIRDG